MNFPEDLRYTDDHEWARLDEENMIATIGITDYAQEKLGDIVYVELPNEGDEVESAEPFGSVESVKAVSDMFAPLSGTVVEINDALVESPEIVNDDPYGEAWMVKVELKDDSEFKRLMDVKAYKKFVAEEEEKA